MDNQLNTETPQNRLDSLRDELARAGVDGFIIPRADEYLGEYVPASGERLAWLTGFTGSAGMAIVLPDRAAVFTDGRYTTQVAQQTDPALWERRHITEEPPTAWLKEHAAGKRIGYDPWLHPQAALDRFAASGAIFVPLAANPLDAIWADRPSAPTAPAEPWPEEFAGRSAAEKREAIAKELREAGQNAVVLADAHSVAWLLNMRGGDLDHTPLALAFALLRDDASVTLFMDPAKAGPALREALGNAVSIEPSAALPAALARLEGKTVRLDPEATPVWFAAHLREAGAELVKAPDPIRLPRACKTEAERNGARAAHRRDARAMVRFLAWFAQEAPKGGLTEISAADRLLAFRQAEDRFRAESFPAIAGAGEHGAIIHYRATEASNRPIGPDESFLLDSGAQYLDGTTDITRTLWTGPDAPPAELRTRYTLVLRGMIALSATRFPEGVAGPHLDAIARRPLWEAGLDYDHGTGHGVGAFLSVHEGPVAFSRNAANVPLREGMILSDEPGFYLPGAYGIRIENLLLVRADAGAPGPRRWMHFETLTLVPFERALIDVEALDRAERAWIDAYHARVLVEVGPSLDGPTADWLRAACAPL
ncbi:aminopeptidase P family protein [Roseomonas xinghualingensis]|uniref:aminopeptidase P family protein n=1 Tax=Roseomonas xinghualingensis TaxID=2986475 RepID=UPI0021F1A758|nr:aminopeptidase P family protein [Roseomonas sp. SXEYE001]MCV4207451.1 aminopeptidase P family protein [Roseomonas sp. SXEYE001]